MPSFRESVDSLIRVEGGFSNRGWDNGGATKYGVTAATLGRHYGLGRPATVEEVKALDLVTARMIYLRFYWLPMHGNDLAWPLAYVLFDGAVNHGTSGATKILQRALGLSDDGAFGPLTVKATVAADARKLIIDFQQARIRKYMKLDDFPIAGRGWLNRIVETLAIAWAGPSSALPENSVSDP